MNEDGLLAALQQALLAMSLWEMAAVVLGIAYLLLATREHLWCWYAAFASTAGGRNGSATTSVKKVIRFVTAAR